MIEIKNGILLDEQELSFITARSSGPGGQNVNKLSTKVTVNFDVLSSQNLDEQQREKILTRLANRISKEGILSVMCQESRSQLDNKQEAVKRLVELLRNALTEKARRIKTKAPKSADHKRLDKKKRHGEVKKWRSKKTSDFID